MPLPPPRAGENCDFYTHKFVKSSETLGDPENVVWSSIKLLTGHDIVDRHLWVSHRIKSQRTRTAIARNLKIYIDHAFDFFEAARLAHTDTAPLIYYYSFLNLAKARCEIYKPHFHEHPESYRHGLSWAPHAIKISNPAMEFVNATRRGVWHVLYEALTGEVGAIPNPLKFHIKNLLSICPEVDVEYLAAFGEDNSLISMINPMYYWDNHKKETWLRFSVDRDELKSLRLSRPKFLSSISIASGQFTNVKSSESYLWTFEMAPKKGRLDQVPSIDLQKEVRFINPFSTLSDKKLVYFIPVQRRLPIRLPQLMVLYTILFWLGSLVRYDPHSVRHLRDSKYWNIIDGFMSQSRIWLLEQFEWEFYQQTTTLISSR